MNAGQIPLYDAVGARALDAQAIGERDTATLSIAATHALSFTFFPVWIRRQMRSRPPGTLNLVSESMEACEQIMLAGEAHFLLCHVHPEAPTRLEADRFQSLRVGDPLDKSVDMGAIVDPVQLKRITELVEQGKAEGGTLLVQTRVPEHDVQIGRASCRERV